MMRRIALGMCLCSFLLVTVNIFAQEVRQQSGGPEVSGVAAPAAPSPNPQATVPRLIKFSGTLEDMAAKPITGVVDVTFAIYREQAGGEPLWFETQRVEADALGRYTVLLGAMSPQGLPAELFTSTAAHWLGVQVANLPESAQGGRILLVSVPYALKALDAETLGGKPASAFQLVAPEPTVTATGPASKTGSGSANLKTPTGKGPTPQVTSGTTGFIGKFINSTDLGNSELFDTGTAIGLGTTTPGATLDINASGSRILLRGSGTHQIQVTGATSGRLGQDSGGFFFASDTNGGAVRFLTNNGALHEWMRVTSAGLVGIGTTAPTHTLEVNGVTTGLAVKMGNGGGIAAIFDNTIAGGKVLSARNNGVEKLSVDTGGNLTTSGSLLPTVGNVTAISAHSTSTAAGIPTLYLENDDTNAAGDLVFDAKGPGFGGECSIDVTGNLFCTGTLTPVAAPILSNQKIGMYTVQSTENWVEDFGSAPLVNGAAVVRISPDFAQIVSRDPNYHVFLTPYGDCQGLYVTNRTATSFEVRELKGGQSSIQFDYRIVAHRAGFEAARLPDVTRRFSHKTPQTKGPEPQLTAK